MAALACIPSASVALVVARASTAGFAGGCAVAAGIVAGDLLLVLLAISGMAALASAMGSFFVILRYVAGAYLVWLGMGLLRSRATPASENTARPAARVPASFLSGLLLTLGDVKALFFYASLLPAFVDLAAVTPWDV